MPGWKAVNRSKDLWSGVIFLALGSAAVALGRDHPMGTAMRMGPAYFPTMLGLLLALIGLAVVLRALLRPGSPVSSFAFRKPALVLGATVLFGLLLRPLGLAGALIAFETTVVLLPFVESNSVRPLATTGATRSITLPNVPTMIESGLAGFEVTNWYGVFGPTGTPKGIVDKLNLELRKILSAPDIRERLTKMGSAAVHGSPEDLARFIKAEVPRWADVVKKSNARVD